MAKVLKKSFLERFVRDFADSGVWEITLEDEDISHDVIERYTDSSSGESVFKAKFKTDEGDIYLYSYHNLCEGAAELRPDSISITEWLQEWDEDGMESRSNLIPTLKYK